MKTKKQLAEQLYPYVAGTAKNRCMSEIDDLLAEIYAELTRKVCNGPSKSDPTIESQMNLALPQPSPPQKGDIAWQPVTAGLYRR